MKIKIKFSLIFLGFGILIAGVVGYFSFNSKTKIATQINQIKKSSILELESSTEIAYIFNIVQSQAAEYKNQAMENHADDLALTKAKLEVNIIRFENALEERKKVTESGRNLYDKEKRSRENNELAAIAGIQKNFQAYKKNILDVIAVYEKTGQLVKSQKSEDQWKNQDHTLAEEITLFKKTAEEEVLEAAVDVDEVTKESIIFLLVFAISTIALGVIAGIKMSNSIVNPILKLNAAINNDTLEDFTVLKNMNSTDEIGELATSLKKMNGDLKKSRREIEEHNKTLERNVEERTREIVNKNHELQLLMQSSSSVLWRLKADDFTVLYVSENITDVLGYTVEEMMAENFWANNLHRKDSVIPLAGVPVVFEKGFLSCQFRFRHKNGTFPWMHADIKCLYDEQGKPYELVGNWWNVTKQKELEDLLKTSNERFELAFKASNDVIYDINLVNKQQWFSDEMFNSFGYRIASSNPVWWKERIHPDDYNSIREAVDLAKKEMRKTWTGTYRFRKADGMYADVSDRLYLMYDEKGMAVRIIGSLSDITHLKKTESDLNAALIKANESAVAKSEFLANMSHEIRTPLNGIVGMTDLALETDLTAEQKRYLDTIRISGDSLMSLINDILDFSKIDAGKLDINPVEFSMRDSISAILQPLGLKASLKKLEFVFSIKNNVPDLWFADVHRLHQIITNLAGNAIKFTEKGEVVLAIELKSLQDEEATLLFSVTDTGIGIPRHKLNSVFEEFIQADGSTTRKYGGTGLGLAITKRLVELMGGKIEVQSKVGTGSVFSFSLKLKLQKDQQQYLVPQHMLENARVLVVEDNRSTRENMVEMLQSFRMKPLAVESGEDAVIEIKKAAAAGDPYSLMLLDISLKGKMDGFDVAEIIKADKEIQETDIIVISMSQQASDRERFALLGVDQYFTKPFSQSDLLDCIQDTLAGINIPVEKIHPGSLLLPVTLNNSNSYKILLVEDNLVNQQVATSMLVKKGHQVVIAGNGEEAVSFYKREFFDLILMDIQMPILNGYEATNKIRLHEDNTERHTPIIGLTANAMKGDREKCLEAGMDDYVSKPVRFADLITALDRVKEKFNIIEEGKIEKPSLV